MGFVTNYDSAIMYYKKSLQGDVTAIVDSNGALKIGYKYDAWGNAASYCSNPNDLLSAITANNIWSD